MFIEYHPKIYSKIIVSVASRTEYYPTRNGFDYYFGIPFSVDMGCVRGCPNPDHPNCTPPPCPDPSSPCTPLPLLRNEEVIQQPANLSTKVDYSYSTHLHFSKNFIA